jgi:hypothetical protein
MFNLFQFCNHFIDFFNSNHEIIKGILKFLASGIAFTQKGWFQKIPTNNDFPHAPWWGYSEEKATGFNSEWEYNPTAVIAGFILKNADVDTEIYKTGLRIAIEALRKVFIAGAEPHIRVLQQHCTE